MPLLLDSFYFIQAARLSDIELQCTLIFINFELSEVNYPLAIHEADVSRISPLLQQGRKDLG